MKYILSLVRMEKIWFSTVQFALETASLKRKI